MDKMELKFIADTISKLHTKYDIRDIHFFGTNNKAMKKIASACDAYAKLGNDEAPMICYDATFFGSATDGFVMTNENIYIHNRVEDNTLKVPYTDIMDVIYEETDSDGLGIYLILPMKRILIKMGTTRENETKSIAELIKETRALLHYV